MEELKLLANQIMQDADKQNFAKKILYFLLLTPASSDTDSTLGHH